MGGRHMKLLRDAAIKYIVGLLLVGTMLFVPAGSLFFINGWLFIGLLFLPMLVLGIVLFFKAPQLLQQRLDAKEKESKQKGVVAVSGLLFVVGFAVAGLDYRFGWSHVPTWVVVAASAILLIPYALYAEVMRENTYLSRTVKVQQGQQVIEKGLYAIVRHPMYAVTVCLFLAIPVVLGSWWSLLCFLPYVVVIIVRIQDEEQLLAAELTGYSDYQKRVRYRLLPFIW